MTSFREGAVTREREPCDSCTSGANAITTLLTSLQAGQKALKAAKQAITQLTVSLEAGQQALAAAEQATKNITIPVPNDVALAMGYKPVDMSAVPDHIKDFCEAQGYFLLEGQTSRVHSRAARHHAVRLAFEGTTDISATPKKPAKKPASAEVVLTSGPITPLVLATPKKPTIMSSVKVVHAAVPTPLGKLTDPSFTSFDESTLPSSFSTPAGKGKDSTNSDSFTSFRIDKKEVTSLFRRQRPVSVSSDEGSTDWEREFSINTSDLIDALPTPSGPDMKVTVVNPTAETCASDDVPPEERWYVVYAGRAPGVFKGYDTIVGNAVGVTGCSYKRCKSELEGRALLEKAAQVGNKVARITYVYEKTYLTAADFM